MNTEKIKVLILGSGGRENAISHLISRNSMRHETFISPGNAMSYLCDGSCIRGLNTFEDIKNFILKEKISLLIIGPEIPLVEGIVDYLDDTDVLIVGPSKAGAMLEGSKSFAKEFMVQAGIPTARSKAITKANIKQGYTFLDSLKSPYVLKADGLAFGKGVLILETIEEAKQELELMLSGKFAQASSTVVIEEYLHGIELSYFVATDGESYKILPSAKDYKRIYDNDLGKNTGGMGAVSPVPFVTAELEKKIEERVVIPTINEIKRRGINYKGFLFIGLMICDGEPFVIEYNTRLGDPEAESILPRIETNGLDFFTSIANKTLSEIDIRISNNTVTTIIASAGGYPDSYDIGDIIQMENVTLDANVTLYGAGVSKVGSNFVTNGGRVFALTSLGESLEEALDLGYREIKKIVFKGIHYRKDIGQDLLNLKE